MVRSKDRDARNAMAYRMAMQQGVLWTGRSRQRGVSAALIAALRWSARPFVVLFQSIGYAAGRAAGAMGGRNRRASPPASPDDPLVRRVLAPSAAVSAVDDASWALRVSILLAGSVLIVFGVVFGVYLAVADGRPHALIVDRGAMAEVIVPDGIPPTALLAMYGVSLGEYDRILAEDHGDDEILRVSRFFPTFIAVDGDAKKAWMNSGTVGDALNKAGVLVREDDLVVPSADTPLHPSLSVDVIRVERKVTEEIVKIDFKTIRNKDSTIEEGKTEVKQKGVDGERSIVTEWVYHDGALYDSRVLSDEVIAEQQTYIVHYGTKPKVTPKPAAKATPAPEKRYTKAESVSKPDENGIVTIEVGGKTYKAKPMVVESTAYTHTGNKTATGTTPKLGTVAVDSSVISIRTKMFVPGYGMGTALDVGVHGAQIDVFFETNKECIRWGRKYDMTIYLLQ